MWQILLYVMVPLVLGLPLDVFHMQTRFYFLRTLVRLIFPIQVPFPLHEHKARIRGNAEMVIFWSNDGWKLTRGNYKTVLTCMAYEGGKLISVLMCECEFARKRWKIINIKQNETDRQRQKRCDISEAWNCRHLKDLEPLEKMWRIIHDLGALTETVDIKWLSTGSVEWFYHPPQTHLNFPDFIVKEI